MLQAEDLTSDAGLIAYHELSHSAIAEWLPRLQMARRALDAFIDRLKKEQSNVL